MRRSFHDFLQAFFAAPFFILLILILLMLILPPFLDDWISTRILLEALVGQIYLVVLVAWLVGMHVSRRSK